MTAKTGKTSNVIRGAFKAESPADVLPPEGWKSNSKYGLLFSNDAAVGPLVRLEEVANWLSERLPRKQVLNQIFFELIAYSGKESDYLYVLNTRDYANQLMRNFRPNRAADSFWQFIPEVEFDTPADLVARGISDAWERVWPGLADPATDNQRMWARALVRSQEWTAREVAKVNGMDDPVLPWPEDDFLLEQIYTLAIPLKKAFELWGYGRVVPAEVLPQAVSQPVASVNAEEWTPERLRRKRDELVGQGVRDHNKQLAALSGLDGREVRRLIESVSKPGVFGSMTVSLSANAGKKKR